MLLGITAALGTTALSAYSMGMITIFSTLYLLRRRRRNRQKVRLPLALWIILSCLSVGVVWAPIPGNIVYMVCAVVTAYLAYVLMHRNGFFFGLAVVCAVQIGVLGYQYVFTDAVRPNGITDNASVVGLAGLFGLPSLPMALMGGLSLSRTAIVGAVAGTFFQGRRYAIAAGVLVIVSVTVGFLHTPDRYTSLDRFLYDYNLRLDTLKGTSKEVALHREYEVRDVEWTWHGYGFGNYYAGTGRIQPHNTFIRGWYELGVLSFVVWGCLGWLWWRWGRDWRLLAMVLVVGSLTDELLGSVNGVYMLLIYAIIHSSEPSQSKE